LVPFSCHSEQSEESYTLKVYEIPEVRFFAYAQNDSDNAASEFPNLLCYWCEVVKGKLVLVEHAAAKWLSKEELDSVEWLPADLGLIEKIKAVL